MVAAGEDLCGPYVWGRYDLLVLPPSFPYGGMENPCLTFVTPTLLVSKPEDSFSGQILLNNFSAMSFQLDACS